MSESSDPIERAGQSEPLAELGQLAAALCEGEITPSEAARLESLARQTPEARRFLLQYIQLHGELYWDLAAGVRPPVPSPDVRAASRAEGRPLHTRLQSALARWAAIIVAACVMVALGWWTIVSRSGRPAADTGAAVAARLAATFEAEWAAPDGSPPDNGPLRGPNGTVGRIANPSRTARRIANPSYKRPVLLGPLRAGQRLKLQSGLAEIAFVSGATVVLQGPATLDVEGPAKGFLHAGRLAANVPHEAAGFTLRTPHATVVDLGTEFGLAADSAGPCEVHTLAGKVRVRCRDRSNQPQERDLAAGQAVRISPVAGGAIQIEELPARPQLFVRRLPPPKAGSVAAMRRLVAQHPKLIHHYTFEGFSPSDRYRDRRGNLHLMEVVMSGGRGAGTLQSAVRGFDETTCALVPYRDAVSGNSTGVALQSDAPFEPPREMTVELLAKMGHLSGAKNSPICVAVGTRASARRCGFLLAAVDGGQLTHLMDGDAPWVETDGDFAFLAGRWYYVACTFRVESGRTRINTWVADLSQGERTLHRIVNDQLVPGVPAAGRLGIGKGFDESGAHAYPWSGSLDEVAIYNAVLDRATLEKHLLAIFPASNP